MVKRYFVIFLLLIAIIGAYAQVREVVHHKGNYYSQATLMVDTVYNVTYEKDTVAVIVPRGEGIVYPSNETMGQFVTWMQGHPVYATPIVQYDSVAHRRNIAGDTLRIIFSNSTDALPQYEKEPIVWQHRQVTISDSAQLLSAEQYQAIAQGGDTSQFIIEPTIIYTDTLYIRNIVDTVYRKPHEYVDLGLSVLWATCNVGAEKPEEYGDYFAWGEVVPKEEYTWGNYKWCDGDYTKLTKYCTKEQYGVVDNQIILELNDDAAHVNMGEDWRMPTLAESNELVSQCTWIWTTINGVNGHQVIGPNGNSIFLPAVGAITSAGLQNEGSSGYYWINSISSTNPYNAADIFNRSIAEGDMSNSYGINAFSRYIGRVIRPICPKKQEHEYVDLGLSVKWATCNVGANSPEEYGDYFAWGETQPKEKYDWTTYKYCKGTNKTMTKYCSNSSYGNNGFTDNKTILDPEDDAATVNWGGSWRMPTDAEMTELREKCTWTWITQNGVNGYKIVGPNGNSIFLPAAGDMHGTALVSVDSIGLYWSSLSNTSNPYSAYRLNFNSSEVKITGSNRYNGLSLRPVCP